jgi:hypothetical protein
MAAGRLALVGGRPRGSQQYCYVRPLPPPPPSGSSLPPDTRSLLTAAAQDIRLTPGPGSARLDPSSLAALSKQGLQLDQARLKSEERHQAA